MSEEDNTTENNAEVPGQDEQEASDVPEKETDHVSGLREKAEEGVNQAKDVAKDKVKSEVKKKAASVLLKNPYVVAALLIVFVLMFLLLMTAIAWGTEDKKNCSTSTSAGAGGNTIIIDAGHVSELDASSTQADYDRDKANWERSKKGANGGTAGNGVTERVANQQVANLLEKELKSAGYNVIMTKTSADAFVSNRERGNIAKKANASLIVKIHNDGKAPQPGLYFYTSNKAVIKKKWDKKNELGEYWVQRTDSAIAEDQKLAKVLNETFAAEAKNQGIKYANGSLYPSRVTEHPENSAFGYTYNIPTTLIEMASLSYSSDAAFIGKSANQEKLAKTFAAGIKQYLPAGTAQVSNYGSPNADGYYQLPESSNYTLNLNGGSLRDAQWGTKEIIDLINTVGARWSATHSDNKFSVGDINDPDHDSHKVGVDADIYSPFFLKKPAGGSNPNYSKDLVIELGKMFLDTKAVNLIIYTDHAVVDELNTYANSNKLPGKFIYDTGHADHFHVRVQKGASIGSAQTTTVCSESTEEETSSTPTGSVGTGTGGAGWILPVDPGIGFVINSHFGPRNVDIGSKNHKGIDLNIEGSGDKGKPIYSVKAGVVAFAGWDTGGCGNYVKVKHDSTYSTLYCHMLEKAMVKTGDPVTAGQQIGKVGTSGRSSGYHLHFGIEKNGVKVDPEDIINFSKL